MAEYTHITNLRGDSAYQVAVNNGFTGTEPDWLDSLKAREATDTPGATLSSAIVLTEEDSLDDLDPNFYRAFTVAVAQAIGLPGDTTGFLEVMQIGATALRAQRWTTSFGEIYTRGTSVAGEYRPWVQTATETQQPPSPSQAILDLALADGWESVYDPTNTATTTVEGGRVMQIRDGLGTRGPLDADDTNTAPALLKGEYGQLAGLDGSNSLRYLASTRSALGRPLTVIALGRNYDPTYDDRRFLFDGDNRVGSNRCAVMSYPDTGQWRIFSGTESGAPGYGDTKPHIFTATFATDGQLSVDGDIRHVGDTGGQALTGLTLGADNSRGRHWHGSYGPLLVYAGEPPAGVIERMERLLRSLTQIPEQSGLGLNTRVLSRTPAGRIDYVKGDPNAFNTYGIQSMTKVITCTVARRTLSTSAALDQTVTVTEDDVWNGNRLAVGDQVAVRDLFYLAAVPSDNTAPYVLARIVGEALLDGSSGDPYERFYQEMQTVAEEWGMTGTAFTHAHSRAQMTPAQVATAFLHLLDDTFLADVFGTRDHDVTITGGPDPRTYEVTHTYFGANSPWLIPEFIAGKSGSGNGEAHSVTAWQHPDGSTRITVVMDVPSPSAEMYREMRRAIHTVSHR